MRRTLPCGPFATEHSSWSELIDTPGAAASPDDRHEWSSG
ncbi:hypothetical protein DB32_006654 [Sandaracinus amylolyticus]|uniref:Uncharacterized protein n=1 Tax=Sandaracinus amylolyticus TaxID=927083 RepID=A0A0F6W7M9_9BACT|nr:hypothetical protein DB32_006654 [Sandaracinus amylolyticus]